MNNNANIANNDDILAHINDQILKKRNLISTKTLSKVESIIKVIDNPVISINKVQTACFYGVPDEINGLRALCWKILLGYLSKYRSKWEIGLNADRKNYEYYMGTFLKPKTKCPSPRTIRKYEETKFFEEEAARKERKLKSKNSVSVNSRNPKNITADNNIKNNILKVENTKKLDGDMIPFEISFPNNQKKAINNNTNEDMNKSSIASMNNDQELSKSNLSQWTSYFKDMRLWDEIEKDTKRTRNELDFFQKTTNKRIIFTYSRTIKKNDPETHSDIMSRILFIYGKLNPGVGYIQGMNEILAPIYYCFCMDDNKYFHEYAEADAFYCFSKLMEGPVKDSFLRKLDDTNKGINSRIKCLNELLKKVDKVLWMHLDRNGISTHYYGLRWLLLLLTQDFELNDVLRLWDALLSHQNRIDFLYYICLAMILGVRDKIMVDDFSAIIQTLQKNASEDLDLILTNSIKLYKQYAKPEEMSYIIFQQLMKDIGLLIQL